MKKFFKGSYFAIIMAFIYIPIIVMIVFSFNSGGTTFSFLGWDTKWYSEFIHNSPFMKSIITSLFVAVISTAISLVIGTMAAIGLSRVKKVTQNSWWGIANVPLINADVVTAVSLMIIFIISGMSFGVGTLIMAHISFNVPYVLITVMPRLRKIDPALIESAQDLGAKPHQVLFKVILPILKPAIITAAAIAFAMSFDDFIISYFTGGSQTNVSTFIYTAKKVKPFIFAFGTILVGAIVLVIIGWNAVSIFKQRNAQNKDLIKQGLYKQKQIHQLEIKIDELVKMVEEKAKNKYTKRPSLWIKYYWVKLKLKYVASHNYDKRIAKLEWKQYRLKSEISREKRYYTRRDNTKIRIKKLKVQLSKKTNDIRRAARLSIQLEKQEDKLKFLNEEIEYIKNRDEIAAKKGKDITKQIKKLKREFKREDEPSKATINWYNKKIKSLEDWKIEVEEGKNNYKLRMVVERLRKYKELNFNQIIALTEKLATLKLSIHWHKPITDQIDEEIKSTTDLTMVDNLLVQRENKITNFNNKLYFAIDDQLSKFAKMNQKVIKAKQKLTPPDDENITYSKGFIARSWKAIAIAFVGISAFTGLTMAYVKNNIYDLVIGNWGEYIDPALISEFESKYGVKVNYQEYDSNETLYNKLYTFKYDVMVPSDYMVQKLAQENHLLKLDYSKLNIKGTLTPESYKTKATEPDPDLTKLNPNPPNEGAEQAELVSGLLDSMHKSKVEMPIDDQEMNINPSTEGTILSYAVPYFWGDLVLVVNPTEDNLQFLTDHGIEYNEETHEIDSSTVSWSILWEAQKANKRLALNSDPKNIFMLAAQKLFKKVNLDTKATIDQAAEEVKDLILKSNVSLNGDDLITKVGLGEFDFALMYNGDALYSNQVYNHEDDEDDSNDGDTKFAFGRPSKNGEGTNIFSDNMVISKKTAHQELAYLWINYIVENMNKITSYVAIASPSQSAMDEMIEEDGDFAGYPDLYNVKASDPDYAKGKTLAFEYKGEIDDYLVDRYNEIVAGKR